MTMTDVFQTMMAASKAAAKVKAKEKASKVPCPNCDAVLPNTGALTQHCKFKHNTKLDKKKHRNSNLLRHPHRLPALKRHAGLRRKLHQSQKSAKRKSRQAPKRKLKRERYTNEKKYRLILAYEEAKRNDPLNYITNFEADTVRE